MASDVYLNSSSAWHARSILIRISICSQSNWSSEDITPISVMFWRWYYSCHDSNGAVDRAPVSDSDVNGADQVSFFFFETERSVSLLQTEFYMNFYFYQPFYARLITIWLSHEYNYTLLLGYKCLIV